MSFFAISVPSSRAASKCAGFVPGAEPQYTQIFTFLPMLGFSFEPDGVAAPDAAGSGDAPPDSIAGGMTTTDPMLKWLLRSVQRKAKELKWSSVDLERDRSFR